MRKTDVVVVIRVDRLSTVRSNRDSPPKADYSLGAETMNHDKRVAFHHGWLIEVVPHFQGFTVLCCSPSRQKLTDTQIYPCAIGALETAKAQVERQVARNTISRLLRDQYEQGKLTADEWQALSQSLAQGTTRF